MSNSEETIINPARQFLKKGLLFLALIVVMFVFFFRSIDVKALEASISHAELRYVLCGFLAMALFIILEGVNIGRGLDVQNIKSSFWQKIKYACYGFFFSSITPSSSGGQPLQLYAMHKDNIDVARGALSLIFELTGFQVASMSLALFGLVTRFTYIHDHLKAVMGFVYLGLTLNSFVLFLLLSALFSKNLSKWCIDLGLRIVGWFKKNGMSELRASAYNHLEQYQEGAEMMKKNPRVSIAAIATSFVQVIALHSITFWVYRALGLSGQSFMSILALQSVLFISVSALPVPGAVGASEGGFLLLYKMVFASGLLDAGLVLSRGISFYVPVLACGCALALLSIAGGRRIKAPSKNSATL